ncbi:trypsin-like peptidase domain-containing protein [Engelhardtia mirabilis]|uniref:Protease 1 n=1 Tax=Engelhardtia mirabilis TaxID=2528011 RepID=A0A518BI88_9BACT|nr:Protease 1 precursor [Planctomycetes bacterium Pla133]QDV01001.1 Protease 1 precursor [Planctomycetes bacterium Pla86]
MQLNQTARIAGLAAMAAAATAATANAQIKEAGSPAAIWADLRTEMVPTEFVQPPQVENLKLEDELNGYKPLRYGAMVPMDLTADQAGIYDELPDGTLIWRFRIYSPGAYSIGLEFDDFVLPEGAQVFMYDDTLETVLGAYGAINNQPNEELLFEPFPGDHVIFEYQQKPGVMGTPELSLGYVVYDYRDVLNISDAQLEQWGIGSGCGDVDVNCPVGDNWELQKRATVRTLSGGALCSAVLLNNTNDDETGYVYTANHCGQSSNTTFRFNYQKSGCNTGSAPTGQNVSGCTVLTSTSTYDNRFLRINNAIPSSYDPYYNGWTRTTQNPTYAFWMGHPGGGVKRIAYDNSGATKGTLGAPNSAWFVDWDEGYTPPGASGGPLFDQNGQVRGTACCVNTYSCPGQVAWFGRFDKFYSANNLAQWLDPAGVNPTSFDGFDPNNPGGGGGGGTTPQIDSISPTTIAAVNPTSPVTITLTGDGFDGVTSVEVDGVPLGAFPPEFTVPNNSTIVVTLQPPYNVGSKTIKVIEGALSDEVVVPVTFNLTPTIDLVNSDPSFLISAFPLEVYMGSFPNDLAFLLVSTSLVPSTLPGIFSASIGNNLSNLFLVNNFVINPATGYAKSEIPISGLPTGTKLYFQAGVLSAVLPSLPLSMSNVESGTVLF